MIARDGEYLVFVEVKYRSSPDKGSPEEAVGFAKQRKICRVADYYRVIHGISDGAALRYDVVGITNEGVKWLKNAFPHRYQ